MNATLPLIEVQNLDAWYGRRQVLYGVDFSVSAGEIRHALDEPVTAVIVGILVFKEPFSLPLLLGIVLIAASVVLIMLGGHIRLLLARRKAAKLDIPPSSCASALRASAARA